ncbi:hypothetical protein CFC21_088407 [Triticum aestivum]|uniref:Uncharacterized protein n=2 Tax=Triticum aestivum TaxID=4565 RepID=A0A9R1IJH0_WHEAT|nr:uncharacterized protein LOC123137911 [Triticum aestivum]KAF7084891.1 hypothetical protein CFC21_088407 [Triticum aestivum]
MGFWNGKGKHDREAGSSSGRRRGSVKKEEPASPPRSSRRAPASPPRSSRRAPAPAPFTIAHRPSGERDRQYICADVCRRYWEMRMPVRWSDAHLPNGWHLFADRVPIPPVLATGRARRDEINRRRRLLPDDLYYDLGYAPDSPLWGTWLQDEHDTRRASYFAGTVSGPRRPRAEPRGRTRVRGLTPTPSPSPSPSPPPPPRMIEEEEARLLQRVMADSMNTHDERQWDGLEEAMALSAAGDVAFPELQLAAVTAAVTEEPMEEDPPAFEQLLGQGWGWSCTALEMAADLGVNWCPTPPRSPEREASPREEVVQAPPAVQPGPVYHAPPPHLWTPPEYVDLVSDDDTGGQ